VSLSVHSRVVRLLRALEDARIPGVVNLHPAYCSILIRFDSLVLSHEALEARVRAVMRSAPDAEPPPRRTIEIPVRYGGEFGPDLDAVAELCGLSAQAVIDLHASTLYTVYFLGFVPGFAYLGSVPAGINVPRLDKPRRSVPAGSVAIARGQTAVYPITTPGGWRLLGRTDVVMFNPNGFDADGRSFSLLNTGDQVRFRPV
jgi:KipI family sensor histidine kinase inhibitor